MQWLGWGCAQGIRRTTGPKEDKPVQGTPQSLISESAAQ